MSALSTGPGTGSEKVPQPAIDLPRNVFRSIPKGSLDRLMKRVQTRVLGDPVETAILDDWWATAVTCTTVRPLETTPLPRAAEPAKVLAGGVRIQGHPRLSARAVWTASRWPRAT